MKRFAALALLVPAISLADSVTRGDSLAPVPVSRVQNSGTNLPRHRILNFTGSGISCADDATNQKTTCTASGGSTGVTSVTGTAPIVSSGGTTPAISITAADGSNAGSLTAAAQTIGGVKTFSSQPVSTNGYALNTSTITESSGDITWVTTNDAAGPAFVFKGATGLNGGSSEMRVLRNNNVIDFNLQTGGTLNLAKSIVLGDDANAVFTMNGNHPARLLGTMSDGASAVNAVSDGSSTLSTAGALIHSFRNNTSEKASITYDGQIRIGIGNVTSAPTCAAGIRGTINYVGGGTGVKDIVQVCAKDVGDSYAWRAIY